MNTTEDFGLFLKNQREDRGIPLEHISSTTRIHTRFLSALEDNRFDDLPGEVFVKGYIQAYAKSLGANSDDFLDTYDRSVGLKRKEEHDAKIRQQENRYLLQRNPLQYILGGFILIVLGAIVFYLLEMDFSKGKPDSVSSDVKLTHKESAPPVPPPAKKTATPAQSVAPDNSSTKDKKTETSTQQSATMSENVSEQSLEAQLAELEALTQISNDAKPSNPKEKPESQNQAQTDQRKKPQAVRDSALSSTSKTETTPPDKAQKSMTSNEQGVIIQQPKDKSKSSDSKEKVASANIPNDAGSEVTSDLMTLRIEVTNDSWFNIVVDNDNVVDFILKPGSVKTYNAKNSFKVTIGNKNAAQMALNGQSLALPKVRGNVVRDFLITPKLLE